MPAANTAKRLVLFVTHEAEGLCPVGLAPGHSGALQQLRVGRAQCIDADALPAGEVHGTEIVDQALPLPRGGVNIWR